MRLLRQLWNDELGAVVSSELILVVTVLVLGMITGLATVRDQVVQELGDVAQALAQANQTYSFGGITGHHASSAGTVFTDTFDDCDNPADVTSGDAPACIALCNFVDVET